MGQPKDSEFKDRDTMTLDLDDWLESWNVSF